MPRPNPSLIDKAIRGGENTVTCFTTLSAGITLRWTSRDGMPNSHEAR